jgi:alpha-galactosidase
MYIVFIKGSGQMGKRFDDPAKMGKWIVENLKTGLEIIVQLYI